MHLNERRFYHDKTPKMAQGRSRAMTSDPRGSVVEHLLRDREVVGSNPGRAIPNALKMVPVATLLGGQYYKAST